MASTSFNPFDPTSAFRAYESFAKLVFQRPTAPANANPKDPDAVFANKLGELEADHTRAWMVGNFMEAGTALSAGMYTQAAWLGARMTLPAVYDGRL